MNLDFLKLKKGSGNYIKRMRKRSGLITLLLFAIAALIFGAGIWYFKSRQNIMTVVAVLGVLPASRSLVNFIMFLKARPILPERLGNIEKRLKGKNIPEELFFFDSVLTVEGGKSYEVDFFICINGFLLGLCKNEKAEAALIEEHLKKYMKSNGIGSVNIKLFIKEKAFYSRLEELLAVYEPEGEQETEMKMMGLIGALSL